MLFRTGAALSWIFFPGIKHFCFDQENESIPDSEHLNHREQTLFLLRMKHVPVSILPFEHCYGEEKDICAYTLEDGPAVHVAQKASP